MLGNPVPNMSSHIASSHLRRFKKPDDVAFSFHWHDECHLVYVVREERYAVVSDDEMPIDTVKLVSLELINEFR